MSRNNIKLNLPTNAKVRFNATSVSTAGGAAITTSYVPASALIVLLLGLVGYFLYFYAMDSPYIITADEAKKRIKAKQIDTVLDVRTEIERDAIGFYPDSVHIPSGEIENRAPAELKKKDARILVYCNTGQRARAATEKLHELGYNNAVFIPTSHFSIMEEPKK